MTVREFYIERLRAERPAFFAVLKAIPPGRADYKPHERSPSADQIVWTLTGELKSSLDAAMRGEAQWEARPDIGFEETIARYEQFSGELLEFVASMSDEDWHKPAKFLYNGRVVSEQPLGQFLWFILFDAIHHRGQLSTYLRPMGAAVPAIYGPSGDSRGAS